MVVTAWISLLPDKLPIRFTPTADEVVQIEGNGMYIMGKK